MAHLVFHSAGHGNCLLDEPRNNKIMSRSHGGRLPGEDYSENKQCELVYGTGSEICPHMVSDGKLRREKTHENKSNREREREWWSKKKKSRRAIYV